MFPWRRGDSFSRTNTPAFTIVDECSSADVGVGATIAPRSHVWNGISADFTIPDTASRITATRIHPPIPGPDASRDDRDRTPSVSDRTISAATNAMPPTRFIVSWRNELSSASPVRVNPINANEHSVVISQKKNIHERSSDRTMPNMALRNVNSRKKNHGLLSGAPVCSW